ncbi:hypothetical protein NUACC21_63530 [Scytonema sp. NUACC21]
MSVNSKVLWLRFTRQILKPKSLAIVQACLIDFVLALAAVLLKTGVGILGGWRVHTTHFLPAWLVLPVMGLSGATFYYSNDLRRRSLP